MNISLNNLSTSVFSCFTQNNAYQLKSTEEKMERIQKTQSQIDFFEGKKAELKDMHCNTLDEIAEKLALYNNYNDQIDAVKKQFNYEQMMHCMDEAEELGEKIAEAAEKMEPKTAEERREDMAEEAMGTDEDKGMMEEMMEDVSDLTEEVEAMEENAEELEELAEETEEMQEAKEAQEKLAEETKQMEEQKQEMAEQQLAARLKARNMEAYQASGKRHPYQALDLLV